MEFEVLFYWKHVRFSMEMLDIGVCCASCCHSERGVLNDLKLLYVGFCNDWGPDWTGIFDDRSGCGFVC